MTERSISRASSDPAIPSKATQTSSPATTAPTAPARPSRSSLAQRRGNACDLPWNVKLSNRVDQLIGKIRGIKELLASFGEAKTLREFQEILALAKDQGTIELALVRAVSALTDAALVELMIDSAQAGGGSTSCRIAGWPASAMLWTLKEVDALGYPLSLGLWCGEQRRLALQVFEKPARRRKSRLTPRLVRRLTEMCAQAAAAERALLAMSEFHPRKQATPPKGGSAVERSSEGREIRERFVAFPKTGPAAGSAAVHDATYLTAVLPFAMAQASRHQEPLTVLMIETDRGVSGVASESAERIRSTNKKIAEDMARSLRGSDVVALLDDNRIIILLPDTSRSQSKEVVEIIRAAITPNHPFTAVDGNSPFRVGIASFPVDAQDMAALLIAADNAVDLPQSPRSIETPKRGRQPHLAASPQALSPRLIG